MELNIENATATYNLNIVGDIHRQTYLGTFKFKCILSPLEHIDADKLYRRLLGEHALTASDRARNHAFALAQLKYRILEYPPFWEHKILNGGSVEDPNVIIDVFNHAIDAEEKYMKAKEEEAKKIQENLTKAIKNKNIQKDPEAEEIPTELNIE